MILPREEFINLSLMCLSQDINDNKLAAGIIQDLYQKSYDRYFMFAFYGILRSSWFDLNLHSDQEHPREMILQHLKDGDLFCSLDETFQNKNNLENRLNVLYDKLIDWSK